MSVLVDTSVWIEYFRSGSKLQSLDFLIDENLIATNELILAELVPFLKVRNQRRLIDLLRSIYRFELSIDWGQIVEYQYQCLKIGLNGIGIPDLIIAQNAKQNRCAIFTLDKHFHIIRDVIGLEVRM